MHYAYLKDNEANKTIEFIYLESTSPSKRMARKFLDTKHSPERIRAVGARDPSRGDTVLGPPAVPLLNPVRRLQEAPPQSATHRGALRMGTSAATHATASSPNHCTPWPGGRHLAAGRASTRPRPAPLVHPFRDRRGGRVPPIGPPIMGRCRSTTQDVQSRHLTPCADHAARRRRPSIRSWRQDGGRPHLAAARPRPGAAKQTPAASVPPPPS